MKKPSAIIQHREKHEQKEKRHGTKNEEFNKCRLGIPQETVERTGGDMLIRNFPEMMKKTNVKSWEGSLKNSSRVNEKKPTTVKQQKSKEKILKAAG